MSSIYQQFLIEKNSRIYNFLFRGFQNFTKINNFGENFVNLWAFINQTWGRDEQRSFRFLFFLRRFFKNVETIHRYAREGYPRVLQSCHQNFVIRFLKTVLFENDPALTTINHDLLNRKYIFGRKFRGQKTFRLFVSIKKNF